MLLLYNIGSTPTFLYFNLYLNTSICIYTLRLSYHTDIHTRRVKPYSFVDLTKISYLATITLSFFTIFWQLRIQPSVLFKHKQTGFVNLVTSNKHSSPIATTTQCVASVATRLLKILTKSSVQTAFEKFNLWGKCRKLRRFGMYVVMLVVFKIIPLSSLWGRPANV